MQPKRVNQQTGLPRRVDTTNPEELRRVLNRILEVLHTMNGEGDPNQRVITAGEYTE